LNAIVQMPLYPAAFGLESVDQVQPLT